MLSFRTMCETPNTAHPAPIRQSPWIERVILNYGCQEGDSLGQLHSLVLAVGRMSQSQAQGCPGTTGLLFLSDGVLQIPALLTASAWEDLTTYEDRETLESLVDTVVDIRECQLQFHMSPEMTRCRFYLEIKQLSVKATWPLRPSVPSCTTLPSVQQKIRETWMRCPAEQESESSQSGFELSRLLEEWRDDCMLEVLEDIQKTLMDVDPQASTSTSWDVDRLRDKGAKCFTAPVGCLLIPEGGAQQLETAAENTPPLVEDDMSYENTISGLINSDITPRSNPWDMFPPPGYSSFSSEASPAATSPPALQNPIGSESEVGETANIQPFAQDSKESSVTSQFSFLPPYQNQPHSSNRLATASSSSSAPVSLLGPSTEPSATDKRCPNKTRPNPPTLDQDKERVEKTSANSKRKRCDSTPERIISRSAEEEEEAAISGSPPSWLFDSHSGSGSREDSLHQQGPVDARLVRKSPVVHGDGSPFSYSYHASAHILQDFSHLEVADSLLQWAVKYLVAPQQTDDPQKTSIQKQLRQQQLI
ncbi:adrenocortical dysplasia protein homolog [Antennarius striatus]|uniref:adrenocortical dysplasia protein homolog n=1 Tax=Antennarius striatus TaxID=241820 RepID=UPI0035B46105